MTKNGFKNTTALLFTVPIELCTGGNCLAQGNVENTEENLSTAHWQSSTFRTNSTKQQQKIIVRK